MHKSAPTWIMPEGCSSITHRYNYLEILVSNGNSHRIEFANKNENGNGNKKKYLIPNSSKIFGRQFKNHKKIVLKLPRNPNNRDPKFAIPKLLDSTLT